MSTNLVAFFFAVLFLRSNFDVVADRSALQETAHEYWSIKPLPRTDRQIVAIA